MLRWLLLIPFAIFLAMLTGMAACLLLAVAVPDVGAAIGAAILAALQAMLDLIFSEEIPLAEASALMLRVSALAASLVLAPVTLMAIACELFRWRSWVVQAGLTALMTIAFPLALLGPDRSLTGPETRIAIALGLVGVAAGTVYWLVAGRGPRNAAAPIPPSVA